MRTDECKRKNRRRKKKKGFKQQLNAWWNLLLIILSDESGVGPEWAIMELPAIKKNPLRTARRTLQTFSPFLFALLDTVLTLSWPFRQRRRLHVSWRPTRHLQPPTSFIFLSTQHFSSPNLLSMNTKLVGIIKGLALRRHYDGNKNSVGAVVQLQPRTWKRENSAQHFKAKIIKVKATEAKGEKKMFTSTEVRKCFR